MAVRELKLMTFAHLGDGWAPCGQLTMTEQGSELMASRFAYGLNYLERTDALEVDPVSLAICGPQSVKGKLLLPANNLVSFGGIRDAAPDAWGRRVIEAKLKVPANSLKESQYLLHAGNERVGALDIRSSIRDEPTVSTGSIRTLAYLMEAAERIEAGEDVPTNLEDIFMDGSALGGARPKATVRDEGGTLWLAKFQSKSDTFDIPSVECATLVLARETGMTVPPVNTRDLGDHRIMMIRRFDRYWLAQGALPGMSTDLMLLPADGLTERRMGFVSGLTLVGCDETESRTKSYADLAVAIRKYCHPSVIRANNEELYKRMVFNIFVSNDDDHLRNHGFLWDPRLPGWRLSPLYDVLPRPSLVAERFLHLGVGPQGRLATLDNALGEPEMFSLSLSRACELVGEVWRVVREWKDSFERSGVSAEDIAKLAPAFRHLDDISTAGTRKLLQ
jgi:serine/threonine-protein kinase HipA